MWKYPNGTPHVPVEDLESPAAPDAFSSKKNHVSGTTVFCFRRLLPRKTPEVKGELNVDPTVIPPLSLYPLFLLLFCRKRSASGRWCRIRRSIAGYTDRVLHSVNIPRIWPLWLSNLEREPNAIRLHDWPRDSILFSFPITIGRPRLCPFSFPGWRRCSFRWRLTSLVHGCPLVLAAG